MRYGVLWRPIERSVEESAEMECETETELLWVLDQNRVFALSYLLVLGKERAYFTPLLSFIFVYLRNC